MVLQAPAEAMMTGHVIISSDYWVLFAVRRNPCLWLAAAALALLCGTSFARAPLVKDHARPLGDSRPPSVLFYSYPPIPSTAYAPQRHVHHYVLDNPLHIGGSAFAARGRVGGASGYERFRYGASVDTPQLPALGAAQAGPGQGLPAYPIGADPTVGSSADGDDWTFHANPLFNLNHSHERGATFSIRHDF
jgi:hypothetical protein